MPDARWAGMRGTATLLIIFLIGALVAIGSGISLSSPLLIAAGIGVGVIGAWLTYRNSRSHR